MGRGAKIANGTGWADAPTTGNDGLVCPSEPEATGMALRPEYALGHSEFNDFLFAVIGEEENGIQLTVFSALTRLGLDPWAEAARLSELTKEAASGALATTIARLPEGDWKTSDSRAIAGRLVNCLPKYAASPDRSSQAPEAGNRKQASEALKWTIWIVFVGVALYTVSRLYWG